MAMKTQPPDLGAPRKAFWPCLALALCLALLSCTPLGLDPGVQVLELGLPGPPEAWSALPDLVFAVEWRDTAWRSRVARLGAGARLRVELPRGRPQSLLAWPESGGHRLEPAGARYPLALCPSIWEAAGGDPEGGPALLDLDWQGGWLAELCVELEAAGLSPETYNLERLLAEEDARARDPWTLDPRVAARALAAGSFRASLLDPPELLAAALPGPGPWVLPSALAEQPTRLEAGWTALLPRGTSRLLGAAGELFVAIDEGGGVLAVGTRAARPGPDAPEPLGRRGGGGGQSASPRPRRFRPRRFPRGRGLCV